MSMEPVSRSVKLRRAALGYHRDLCARGAAVFSLVCARQNLEFLDGIKAQGNILRGIASAIDIADAIDSQLVLVGAGAIRPNTAQPAGSGRLTAHGPYHA